MKTKETNPTRPGSPTPCKQALSSLFSMFNNIRIPYSLNVLFPRDNERFKVPRIGVPHGTFPTGCAPLEYRLLIMGRTADRHALQFLHHLWICYLNTYQANRLTTRLSETQSLIAKRKNIFICAHGRLHVRSWQSAPVHVDCEQSLSSLRFSEGSARARKRRASSAFSYAGGHLRVSCFSLDGRRK